MSGASAEAVRGFVLEPTYRIESGRPVVHLYGVLEGGGSFLVRDRREVPRFWVRETDVEAARAQGARPLVPAGKVTLDGEPVARVEVSTPMDAPPLRDRLTASGIPCFEADVRFAMRYLIDRGIRSAVTIRGSGRPGTGIGAVFEDPEIAPGDFTPTLRVLSLDIETDPRAQHLLSVALHGCGASEVLLLARGRDVPSGTIACGSEKELLQALLLRVRELDPDVLTGWNVVDFDLAVLARIASVQGVPLELGRGRGEVRVDPSRGRWAAPRATVPGRVVLDGIQLLRGAFVKTEDYSLDTVAREILGEGKRIAKVEGSRAHEILRLFREDRDAFVAYNLADARLVLEILDKLRLVELAVERSLLTGMPPDRVASSIAAFEFLYLSELGKAGIVAPTVRMSAEAAEPMSGGHVLEPAPGLYRNVLAFDFKSLYPSIIRTFEIDPLGYVRGPRGTTDPIVAPNGAAFRRERGILPRLLDDLVPRREAAQAAGDRVKSHAIKILMNSFYGVLGTSACRFYNPEIANAITGFGREILLWSKERLEAAGHRVLYGDTDSLFALSETDDPEEARRLGHALAAEIDRQLAEHLRAAYRVSSRLTLEFETLYLRFLLPHTRHGLAGARKRYAGLVESDGTPRVEFTGMEVVRRDWTELAKRIQRELFERLFSDRPVHEYLEQVVADLRSGSLDDLLEYRKGIRKSLEEYTATTPPHVAAARKMLEDPGRRIAYVITVDGPEPVSGRRSAIDHEHYVQKQVRPVAEPVLELLGLEFDRVIGDAMQHRLF